MDNKELRGIVGHTGHWRRFALRRLRGFGVTFAERRAGNVRIYLRLVEELIARQRR